MINQTFRKIIELLLGVKIRRQNFRKNRIGLAIIIVIFAVIILGPANLFDVVDRMMDLTKQAWYVGILAKFSFLMVFVRTIAVAMFTDKNNPFGRFKAAFATQLLGLVGTTVLNFLLNDFIRLSNIDSQIKFVYGLLPFVVSIIIMLTVRWIYNVPHFDEKKFFNSKNSQF